MADSRRTRPGSRQRVAGLRKRSTQNKTAKTGLSRPGREAGATEAVEKGPVEEAPVEEGAVEEGAASATSSDAEQAADESAAEPTSDSDEAGSSGASGDAAKSDDTSAESGAGSSAKSDSPTAKIGPSAQTGSAAETGSAADASKTGGTTDQADQAAETSASESTPVGKSARRDRGTTGPRIWTPEGPAAEPEPEPAAESAEPAATSSRGPSSWLVNAGFAGAVVLACLAVWFGVEVYANSTATQNEALVDQAATSEVNGQMSDAVSKIFSYDFADTAKTEQAAKNVLTGDAIKQYDQLFATVKQQAPLQKLVVTTTVKASSVLRLEGDRAQVLLFVDQNATRTDNGGNQVGPAQVVVTAEKQGDQWKISNIAQH